ncbi:MAG: aldehyde dehydrogenase family protein, partial [bacterium]
MFYVPKNPIYKSVSRRDFLKMGGGAATALGAGCSVICKPDVITPGCVMELMNIINDAGVPPGVVNLL